jgi:hypothetical protein
MESCVNILAVTYFLIQAIIVFAGIGILCPIVLIRIAFKLKLKSFNWFAIAFWLYISTIWQAVTNPKYHDFLINYLPTLTCGKFY